jgi:oligo-1,6-glucosidase/alpha-glucosidase
MRQDHPWWKTTTIYQIYPRSYKDTNGDGIGDLAGIIEKLDYIHDLGFETLWISPFFDSPQQDWGYDISGYRSIAPEYGPLEDAERLIEEVHKRNMKVIFDLVLNHSSSQHPWFIESSSSRDNPKSDWYIWWDGKDKGRPPNNWKALPGGSGWHYHPERDQFYYASFLPFQPDLNFRNPEVKKEMIDVAKFWLDKGVDGFRLDIFHAIYKAEHLQDNPRHWSYFPRDERTGFFTEWKYTVNQPETIQLAHELRQFFDQYTPNRFMVGEIFGKDQIIREYLGDGSDGMHSIFLWEMMHYKFQAEFFWKVLDHYETWYPPPLTPVLVLGNHDSKRWIDRINYDLQKAKLITLLQLTARGIPVVYYGEEIGLPEGMRPAQDALDPVGRRYAWVPKWMLALLDLYVNRDNCRTPMAWDSTYQAGFTDSEKDPWLPLSADPKIANVADQIGDPDSLLNWYKTVLHFRNSKPTLQAGTLTLLPKSLTRQGVLGYIRQDGPVRLAVLINMKKKPVSVDLAGAQIEIQTGQVSLTADQVVIDGLSGCVVSLVP